MEEWKPPKGDPGPTYNFRRGYDVKHAKRHETADQFNAFQKYLTLQPRKMSNLCEIVGKGETTLKSWAKKYKWEQRAAAYDKDQMAIVWKSAQKLQRNTHKDAIVHFQQTSERHALQMAEVAENILRITQDRIKQAEETGEEIPMSLVSGLLRSATGLSDQSRQAWANALGINEMMQMVEQEIEKAEVQDITDTEDPYDIPLDE